MSAPHSDDVPRNRLAATMADLDALPDPAWADVTGKPTTFAPSAHTHTMSDVDGLSGALSGKVDDTDPRLSDARTPTEHRHEWDEIDGKPASYSPSSHSHPISQVTSLQAALDSKADVDHTHTPAQVGLGNVDNTADASKPVSTATQAALDAKVQLVAEFPTSPESGVLYLKADD